MIDVKEYKAIIAERKRIAVETDDHWDYGIEMCWNKLIDMLTKDINETIDFLENVCSPDEINWTSEIFEDIVQKTNSKEFVAALHRIYEKMPEDVKQSIAVDIKYADLSLD